MPEILWNHDVLDTSAVVTSSCGAGARRVWCFATGTSCYRAGARRARCFTWMLASEQALGGRGASRRGILRGVVGGLDWS
eukprot:5075713-Alexandrium_andersonii.AAC.1